MAQKKKSVKHGGFIEMEEAPRTIIIQTGRQTPPDAFLWDLDFIDGIRIEAKRLAADFRSGGLASFVMITTSANTDATAIAGTISKHLQRLKRRGHDDLVLLVGGSITATGNEISFKDVKCRRQIPLKGMSQDEILNALNEALAEAL